MCLFNDRDGKNRHMFPLKHLRVWSRYIEKWLRERSSLQLLKSTSNLDVSFLFTVEHKKPALRDKSYYMGRSFGVKTSWKRLRRGICLISSSLVTVWKLVMRLILRVLDWIKVLSIAKGLEQFSDLYSIFWALLIFNSCWPLTDTTIFSKYQSHSLYLQPAKYIEFCYRASTC